MKNNKIQVSIKNYSQITIFVQCFRQKGRNFKTTRGLHECQNGTYFSAKMKTKNPPK